MKRIGLKFIGANFLAAVLFFSAAPAVMPRGPQPPDHGGGGGCGGGHNAFSGRAVVVDATIKGIRTLVADTGPLPAAGGSIETSLLDVDIMGLLTAEVAHAATIGQGDRSRSEASLASLNLAAVGHGVSADFLIARAEARCGQHGASSSGSSELANLVIDGQAITVSGESNQTIMFPAGTGYVIINEQNTSSGNHSSDITVDALHVVIIEPITGETIVDVIIASAHADITCNGGHCTGGDFVTGGGWINTPTNAHGNFGVAGGVRNNTFWGHLEYVDHGSGMRVHGTGVTAYSSTSTTSRHIEGTAEVNGQGGFTYSVDVADNGEPGTADTFAIQLSSGYAANGNLQSGNIQLHRPCR